MVWERARLLWTDDEGMIARTTGCSMMRKGSRRGLRLDHPLTLGIIGIGCDTSSEGALAHGDVSRLTPGIVRGQLSLPLAPP